MRFVVFVIVTGFLFSGAMVFPLGIPDEQDSGGASESAVSDFDQWRPQAAESPWSWIVIHHSASASGSVREIDADHRRRTDASGNRWLGIGYHFVIGNGSGMEDGEIAATFRWDGQVHGAHSGHAMFNARGIGICLIGDFQQGPPTEAQWESVRKLVRVLSIRYEIPPESIIGHSSVKATSCPGRYFPLKELRAAAARN